MKRWTFWLCYFVVAAIFYTLVNLLLSKPMPWWMAFVSGALIIYCAPMVGRFVGVANVWGDSRGAEN